MEELEALFLEILNEDFMDMVASGQRSGDVSKLKVRPVLVKNQLAFQVTRYVGTQVFHENGSGKALAHALAAEVHGHFKQVQIRTKTSRITVLVSKRGAVSIKNKKVSAEAAQTEPPEHNRKKAYILEEGRPVPFLIDLGVMTADGRIISKRYDKYRQINRFLEFIEDILPQLDKDRELTIIDFGCGKSYLTFAMYYYMKVLKGYDIRITGLDLKMDVIRECNRLRDKYGYDRLEFLHGDIADFEGVREVDMVVTLHACDTATDYALYKAALWRAKVILSVPCCQHELNGKMHSETLDGMLQYGLIRERFAALATDSMRAMLLESVGYKMQILEFIDMAHTPKNILLRGVRKGDVHSLVPGEKYNRMKALIHTQPVLEKLLMGMDRKKIGMK